MLLSTPAGSIPGTKEAGGSRARHHVCLTWGPAAVSSEVPDAVWHLSVPTKPTKALLWISLVFITVTASGRRGIIQIIHLSSVIHGISLCQRWLFF